MRQKLAIRPLRPADVALDVSRQTFQFDERALVQAAGHRVLPQPANREGKAVAGDAHGERGGVQSPSLGFKSAGLRVSFAGLTILDIDGSIKRNGMTL